MRKYTRRKCLHCGKMYHPDPRTRDRQRHCAAPECRRASKAKAQARWRAKAVNRDYFKGPEQVDRVRRWRKANPGYGKKPAPPDPPLQDDCRMQGVEYKQDKSYLVLNALQDDSSMQPLILLGLISSFMGSSLQDDMVSQIHKMHARGQQILGNVPGSQPQGTHEYTQTPPSTRPPAPGASAVQLARSPPGP